MNIIVCVSIFFAMLSSCEMCNAGDKKYRRSQKKISAKYALSDRHRNHLAAQKAGNGPGAGPLDQDYLFNAARTAQIKSKIAEGDLGSIIATSTDYKDGLRRFKAAFKYEFGENPVYGIIDAICPRPSAAYVFLGCGGVAMAGAWGFCGLPASLVLQASIPVLPALSCTMMLCGFGKYVTHFLSVRSLKKDSDDALVNFQSDIRNNVLSPFVPPLFDIVLQQVIYRSHKQEVAKVPTELKKLAEQVGTLKIECLEQGPRINDISEGVTRLQTILSQRKVIGENMQKEKINSNLAVPVNAKNTIPEWDAMPQNADLKDLGNWLYTLGKKAGLQDASPVVQEIFGYTNYMTAYAQWFQPDYEKIYSRNEVSGENQKAEYDNRKVEYTIREMIERIGWLKPVVPSLLIFSALNSRGFLQVAGSAATHVGTGIMQAPAAFCALGVLGASRLVRACLNNRPPVNFRVGSYEILLNDTIQHLYFQSILLTYIWGVVRGQVRLEEHWNRVKRKVKREKGCSEEINKQLKSCEEQITLVDDALKSIKIGDGG